MARELSIDPQLIRGDNGVFDVIADGDLVFSKHEAGRFPDDAEIVELLRCRT